MSQIERINFYNAWPAVDRFAAEEQFAQHLNTFNGHVFQPIALSSNLSASAHIALSHVLDALDSLPMRPDHAFDWVWKAFEHTCRSAAPICNITDSLRSYATPTICKVLSSDAPASSGINQLASLIPFQTAEYMLKKIIAHRPYVNPVKSFAKRILFANGNPPVVSKALQALLDKLSSYDYSKTEDRRKGASLLVKALKYRPLKYPLDPLGTHTLSQHDVVFFLLSGLAYGFRNDRAHANSISPFKSSTARIKTYAHCWFCFLVIYDLLAALWKHDGLLVNAQTLGNNYSANNAAFRGLFGNHLGQ